MSNKNLSLDLNPRVDKHGNTYYVAKLEGPFTIDCKDGVVFLVYVSEQGGEELQIAHLKEGKNAF